MAPPHKPAPPQPVTPPQFETIPLPGGSEPDGRWESFLGNTIQRNVTVPHLHIFRPNAPNGKAVLICPGGGYQFLSMSNEGSDIARDMAAEGYLAVILSYRTNPTPEDPEAFLVETGKLFRNMGKEPLPTNALAAADLGVALDYLADNAGTFGLTTSRASVIGFSAGARTIMSLMETTPAALADRSVALIYPTSENALTDIPQSRFFMAIASDDPLFQSGTFDLVQKLSASAPIEFHLYETGDHGFGRSRPGTSADGWFDQYTRWLGLEDQGT